MTSQDIGRHSAFVEALSLPRLPSHPPHPLRPRNHILSRHQPLNGPIVFRQLLIASNPMHKAMAGSAEPRYTVQPPFFMPATFDGFPVDLLRDEVMVAQWDPVPLADLAGGGTSGGPDWWGGCHGGDV